MEEAIELSIVIPAYQEARRIGNTMAAISAYLEAKHPGSEVVLVCDGCTDGTAMVARQFFNAPTCQLKIIELATNQGKGNAVKEGMLAGLGSYLLFTDADLSYEPELIDTFVQELKGTADIVIAQRQKTVTYAGATRKTLAVLSRALIGNIILPGIRDTQAGLKGFRKQAAKKLFAALKTKGFLFDLEILLAARRNGFHIEKVYVDWCDRPGSTVRVVKDTIRASIDLTSICSRELLTRFSLWRRH